MHYRRTYLKFLVLLSMIFCLRVPAQVAMDYATTDSVSYRLYEEKSWTELEDYCGKAIGAGIDYYYLRMRAGIASYELQHYRKAIVHFQKALEFNSGDPVAGSYLYGSYILAARYEDARRLSAGFDSSTVSVLGLQKNSAVAFVGADCWTRFASSTDFDPGFGLQLSGGHYVANRFLLGHYFNYYGQDEFRNTITQFQYCIRPVIPLKKNFLLTLGVHGIRERLDRKLPPAPPGMPPPPPGPTDYLLSLIGAATITAQTQYMDYEAGITAGVLDSVSHYQAMFALRCYPFANNKFALGAYLHAHSEDGPGNIYFAFVPVLQANFSPRFGMTAAYYTNPEGNIAEYTALVVNNSEDETMGRFSVNMYAGLTKRFYLNAGYTWEQKFTLDHAGRYYYNGFQFGLRFFP